MSSLNATRCLLVARASPSETRAEPLPLFLARVPAGFPSPADDHLEGALDVHALLVRRPAATFFCRADGPSMQEAGVHDGDLLVVDRSLEPMAGDVVVATIADGLTVKRLTCGDGEQWFLAPTNPDFPPLPIDPAEGVRIWGVVTWSLTNLCKR